MLRRRIHLRVTLLCLLATLVMLRWIYDQEQPAAKTGRHLQLIEGQFVVNRIVDPITMVVTPVQTAGTPNREPLTVRLASLNVNPDRPPKGPLQHEFELTKLIGSGTVYLRFDRQRFDIDQTPIAYGFANGKLLNAQLVGCREAIPKTVAGNSSKLQRMIIEAYQPDTP